MPSTDKKVRVFEELAEWEHKQGSPQARDRFLILAADAALTAGLADEAERFRARLLEYNPHHLLRPYNTLTEAMRSSDVYGYIADLRGSFPPEEAEKILAALQGSGRPPDTKLPAESPPVEDTPTVLPDPPPLEAFRFGKDDEKKAASPARGGDGPSDSPLVFGALRDPPATVDPAASKRKPAPVRREPRAPAELRDRPPDSDEPEEPASGLGVWLSDALFFLLLAVGLTLAVYTVARPFLPLGDSPLR